MTIAVVKYMMGMLMVVVMVRVMVMVMVRVMVIAMVMVRVIVVVIGSQPQCGADGYVQPPQVSPPSQRLCPVVGADLGWLTNSEWEDQWHVDSFKSFIHLSVTLQGSRTVWTKTANTKSCDADEQEVSHVMSAGSFYFTAPTGVKHNMEWPKSDWKDRSICIQFRTQVPCQRFRPNDVRLQLARSVSSVMEKTTLVKGLLSSCGR